jgi:hypothetical protein
MQTLESRKSNVILRWTKAEVKILKTLVKTRTSLNDELFWGEARKQLPGRTDSSITNKLSSLELGWRQNIHRKPKMVYRAEIETPLASNTQLQLNTGEVWMPVKAARFEPLGEGKISKNGEIGYLVLKLD